MSVSDVAAVAGIKLRAEEIAREAVGLIRATERDQIHPTATKSSSVDVVTATDQAVESLIRERIAAFRPQDSIIGEEGEDTTGKSDVEWIIDPIDGTVNFIYGIPAFAVSIGVRISGVPTIGVVMNAQTGVEYSAMVGDAATRDGKPIRVRVPQSMELALVATGFGYDAELRGHQAQNVASMLTTVRDIRRIGSCALDLCGVAEGSVNCYVEEGPHIWDYAAGQVIAEAAGARFDVGRSPRGKPVLHCAPEPVFGEFAGLLHECGFLV
jgi:myo-inositol-1(or 4)-monophosphatase